LLTAAPLLALGGQRIELLLIGVALLQSATPPMLALMAQTTPRYPATAAGLALGLAIAIGGVPFVGGPTPVMGAPPVVIILLAGALFLLWIAFRLQRARPPAPQ
jgi:FSR family fosmidomycin resistance protein-like MFS transporter